MTGLRLWPDLLKVLVLGRRQRKGYWHTNRLFDSNLPVRDPHNRTFVAIPELESCASNELNDVFLLWLDDRLRHNVAVLLNPLFGRGFGRVQEGTEWVGR